MCVCAGIACMTRQRLWNVWKYFQTEYQNSDRQIQYSLEKDQEKGQRVAPNKCQWDSAGEGASIDGQNDKEIFLRALNWLDGYIEAPRFKKQMKKPQKLAKDRWEGSESLRPYIRKIPADQIKRFMKWRNGWGALWGQGLGVTEEKWDSDRSDLREQLSSVRFLLNN